MPDTPTKLYYELRNGNRSNVIAIKLTDEELEHLDKLAGTERRPNGPKVGRAEILRWGLYKVLDEHGFTMWDRETRGKKKGRT